MARDYKFPAFTYEFSGAGFSASVYYFVIFLIELIFIINFIFKKGDAKFYSNI